MRRIFDRRIFDLLLGFYVATPLAFGCSSLRWSCKNGRGVCSAGESGDETLIITCLDKGIKSIQTSMVIYLTSLLALMAMLFFFVVFYSPSDLEEDSEN